MPNKNENEADQSLEQTDRETPEETVEDEAAKDSLVTKIQYDIASYGADYDVEGLVNRLRRGDILIPPFQRNYIWKQTEASRFIESLLLGLPVPGVFLAREPVSEKLLVIDGQQRLKSLQFFYDGFFNPREGDAKKQVFKLIGVQESFEGSTYEKLDERDRIRLNDSLIHATIIKQEAPKDDDTSIYHVFDRLNSYGRLLTPQEIRTAIDHGTFIELIKELNGYKSWREIFGKVNNRLKDQELILRFLAFFFNNENYQRPMNEFLNKFSRAHRTAGEAFCNRARLIFTNAIDVIHSSIGSKAFRPVSAINAAVFDSVMYGIARRLESGPLNNDEGVRAAYAALLIDQEYISLTSQSTSDENNVKARLGKAVEAFAIV
jgi:hypothetical protein